MTLNLEEMIEFLNHTNERLVPFPLSEIADAMKEASERNPSLIKNLLESFISSTIRLNPSRPREEMINSAYDNLATLAYLADCNPSSGEFSMDDVAKAYEDTKKYGKVMTKVSDILKTRGIDLCKYIYWEKKIELCLN
jgi:predicted KAP-like P-loop ATPase